MFLEEKVSAAVNLEYPYSSYTTKIIVYSLKFMVLRCKYNARTKPTEWINEMEGNRCNDVEIKAVFDGLFCSHYGKEHGGSSKN